MGKAGGIDLEIGGLLVDREAGFQKGIEGGSRVLHLEQGAFAAAGRPFEEDFRIGVEPDRGADGAEDLPVHGAQDRAAARGQNDRGGSDQPLQGIGFPFPEAFLALLGEKIADAPAICRLDDQLVAVEEFVSQSRGKPPADAAFAAAHEADEDNVPGHGGDRNGGADP
jgi:hypothetical protein